MLNLIAAVGKSGQIGLNGELPWPKNREDLLWFKRLTIGCKLIVGQRTAEKLPPLAGRELVIMTRDNQVEIIQKALEWAKTEEIWVIGGAYTYSVFAPYVQRLYVSRIDYDGAADTYMPSVLPR